MSISDGNGSRASLSTSAAPVKKERGTSRLERPLPAAIFMLAVVALMYLLEVIDQSTTLHLDQYGIKAHHLDGLPGMFAAPFLHASYGHLSANALPFLVLGWLTLIGGLWRFLLTTFIIIITSGLAAWALTFPKDNQVIYIVGASGVIVGWLAYLLLRGIFTRNVGQIIISAVVLIAYGTALFAVFPQSANVSWQAHLGGAIGGVLAAWLLRRSGPTGLKSKASKVPAASL